MAPIIRAEQIAAHVGEEVTLRGWVYNRTHKGKLVFLLVRDGYGFVQCVVFNKDVPEEVFETAVHIPQESSLIITGVVRADPRAPGIPGGFELGVTGLEVVQEVTEEYPIALKEHGVDFLLDNRHLWIRTQSQWGHFRRRHKLWRLSFARNRLQRM